MADDPMDEVVGRVREFALRYSGPRRDNLTPYEVRALNAIDSLIAAFQSLREDKARLDYLNHAVPSGEFREAIERTMGEFLPDPFDIRQSLDRARTGGTE